MGSRPLQFWDSHLDLDVLGMWESKHTCTASSSAQRSNWPSGSVDSPDFG